MALELDDELRDQLSGKTSFQECRPTAKNRRHFVTYAERQGMGFARERHSWQKPRKVPPFTLDDGQLKSVIVHVTVCYVFRNSKVPPGLVEDLKFLDRLARDRSERMRAIIDGRADEYWNRFHHNLEMVDAAGGWMAMISGIAYRSYRLHWHAREVADSLGLTVASIRAILQKLKRAAFLMGFDIGPYPKSRTPHGNSEEILKLWQAGKSIKQINAELGASQDRIRTLLKKQGVWRHNPGRSDAISPEKISKLAELWHEGISLRAIAELVGIHKASVLYHCKRLGLHRKPVTSHRDAEVPLAVRVPING